MSEIDRVVDFILRCRADMPPAQAIRDAKRSLLDLFGVAAAGTTTGSSRIARDTAFDLWPAGAKSATLMFDGRRASIGGAAFAGAQTIDSIDAHDGFKFAKGHAGVTLLPALLAMIEAEGCRVEADEFLSLLIAGYEIACRVAVAQHRTCPDYHASGSWNALGAAAIAASVLQLNRRQVRQALGIAEYYGPRSQMMRVVDHPSMVKDSSAWGAMAGVTAAYLAQRGFTGAPVMSIEPPDVADVWQDLGRHWLVSMQYFKPWPVCRWAQPAVQAALELKLQNDVQHSEVESVEIHTFHEACRLAGHAPTTTDEAQYAIAFPTACALVRGAVGMDEIAGSGLTDPAVQQLARRITFVESAEYNAVFPAHRRARLVVRLKDGCRMESRVAEPPGDPELPLSDQEIEDKFYRLAEPVIGQKAIALRRAVGSFHAAAMDMEAMLAIVRSTGRSATQDAVTSS